MKTRGLIVVTLFLAAFSLASVKADTGKYSAQLISPTAGQVLYPGQVVRVEWRASLPKIQYPDTCEMEVLLSLDGGRTFNILISPWLDPKARYFYWTVPNTPTNAAVLDVRFGCEQFYPETYAPQPASMFVITQTTGQLY